MSNNGTNGIVHSIHVADVTDSGDLENFREIENVVDAMNMPNGTIKFTHEGKSKTVKSGKIVRSTVRGLDESFRYRCTKCESRASDLIGIERGDSPEMRCPVCDMNTEFSKLDINKW